MQKRLENLITRTNNILANTPLRGLVPYSTPETWLYLVMGGLTTLVGFGSYVWLVRLGWGTMAANTLSTVLATLFAYVTNKLWVFESPSWRPGLVLPEFVKFCTARVFTFVAETALLVLLVDALGLHSAAMKACTMVLVIIGNYALSKWVVFTRK